MKRLIRILILSVLLTASGLMLWERFILYYWLGPGTYDASNVRLTRIGIAINDETRKIPLFSFNVQGHNFHFLPANMVIPVNNLANPVVLVQKWQYQILLNSDELEEMINSLERKTISFP